MVGGRPFGVEVEALHLGLAGIGDGADRDVVDDQLAADLLVGVVEEEDAGVQAQPAVEQRRLRAELVVHQVLGLVAELVVAGRERGRRAVEVRVLPAAAGHGGIAARLHALADRRIEQHVVARQEFERRARRHEAVRRLEVRGTARRLAHAAVVRVEVVGDDLRGRGDRLSREGHVRAGDAAHRGQRAVHAQHLLGFVGVARLGRELQPVGELELEQGIARQALDVAALQSRDHVDQCEARGAVVRPAARGQRRRAGPERVRRHGRQAEQVDRACHLLRILVPVQAADGEVEPALEVRLPAQFLAELPGGVRVVEDRAAQRGIEAAGQYRIEVAVLEEREIGVAVAGIAGQRPRAQAPLGDDRTAQHLAVASREVAPAERILAVADHEVVATGRVADPTVGVARREDPYARSAGRARCRVEPGRARGEPRLGEVRTDQRLCRLVVAVVGVFEACLDAEVVAGRPLAGERGAPAVAATDLVAGGDVAIDAVLVPVGAVEPEAQRVADRPAERGRQRLAAVVAEVAANRAFRFLRGVLGDVLDRAREGAAPVERALRTLDDLDPRDVDQALRREQRAARDRDALAADVDAVDQHRHVVATPRRRQAADRDARVGGAVAALEDQRGIQRRDVADAADVEPLEVRGLEGRDAEGDVLQVLLALARGDDDLFQPDDLLGRDGRGDRHRESPGD